MWLIAGTVPEDDFPLNTAGVFGAAKVDGPDLVLPDGTRLPIARGTTALAATAILASQALGAPPPRLLLAGDCGKGAGSRVAYAWLTENAASLVEKEQLAGIVFHYFYPDLAGHDKLFMELEELKPKPILVADAGFMYGAKMSGYAASYDLFPPDLGELAFLADELAPHPFYTRGFLLAETGDAPGLIKRALANGNCPANAIVKGATDYIVCNGEVAAEISTPSVEAMECIGGTGDMVAGFASAWLAAGSPICESALRAARATRWLGFFCQPTPAAQAAEIIGQIGPMLAKYREEIEK